MSMLFDFNKLNILGISKKTPPNPTTTTNSPQAPLPAPSGPGAASSDDRPMILRAPQAKDIKFFDETPPLGGAATTPTPVSLIDKTAANSNSSNRVHDSSIILSPLLASAAGASPDAASSSSFATKPAKVKKKVRFPEDDKIIKDFSEAPKRGWQPGSYPTSDLLDAYVKSCERHKCKPLAKLLPHLKALQDLDCTNGEKVNVLNLKNEHFDSRQMEALEEIFKRLSFKTIDLESSTFDDETTAATLFDILDYYDTCEKLILANARSINLYGWQSLAKFIRKSVCLELLDLRGHTFPEFIYFTYIARSMRLTTCLRVIHLENSNIQGRLLLMLAAALKDNEQIREVYLGDNKIQPSDAHSLATIIKENKCLELLDLRNNSLGDSGISHICRGLCEQESQLQGLRALVISNNSITQFGISFLSKALIHNRSISTLNLSMNALTNQAIYELKESLIVNKQITCLILMKVKLTDEGVVALAEYLAETQSLRRLDLRENDIRLGGLMALASSLKFNKTLVRLDLDQREPKRDYYIKDSVETTKRLIQDIHEYCMRNKRLQNQQEAEMLERARVQELERKKNELENEKRLVELINEINSQLVLDKEGDELDGGANESSTDPADYTMVDEDLDGGSSKTTATTAMDNQENTNNSNAADPTSRSEETAKTGEAGEEDEELGIVVDEEDELLKRILGRHTHHSDTLSSPLNDELITNYFSIVDDVDNSLNIISKKDEEYDYVESEAAAAAETTPKVDAKEQEDEAEILVIASSIVEMITRKVQNDIENAAAESKVSTTLESQQQREVETAAAPDSLAAPPALVDVDVQQSMTESQDSSKSENELSFIIEKESSLTDSSELVSKPEQAAEEGGNEMSCSTTSVNGGAGGGGDEEDADSDIEVLTVSKKAKKKDDQLQLTIAETNHQQTERASEQDEQEIKAATEEPTSDVAESAPHESNGEVSSSSTVEQQKVAESGDARASSDDQMTTESNKPPHFASQLTNSQLSEELSSEIGL